MTWKSQIEPEPAPLAASPPLPKRVRARLETIGDVKGQLATLYREARSGRIDTQDATRLASILAMIGRLIADNDLEARIAAMEARTGVAGVR